MACHSSPVPNSPRCQKALVTGPTTWPPAASFSSTAPLTSAVATSLDGAATWTCQTCVMSPTLPLPRGTLLDRATKMGPTVQNAVACHSMSLAEVSFQKCLVIDLDPLPRHIDNPIRL